jgi:hypothetical protein
MRLKGNIMAKTQLSTSKLALKLEIKTNELNKKFVQMGYLEKKSKDYHLTQEGKKAGGETKSTGKRAYVLWDEKIEKEIKVFDEKNI